MELASPCRGPFHHQAMGSLTVQDRTCPSSGKESQKQYDTERAQQPTAPPRQWPARSPGPACSAQDRPRARRGTLRNPYLRRFFLSPPLPSPSLPAMTLFSSTSALTSARSASHAAQTGRVATWGPVIAPGQASSARICGPRKQAVAHTHG